MKKKLTTNDILNECVDVLRRIATILENTAIVSKVEKGCCGQCPCKKKNKR